MTCPSGTCSSSATLARSNSFEPGMFEPVTATHLASISRRRGDDDAFPFTVPAIRSLDRLQLDASVTFFVGENGSGKSTLLEGIAAAARLATVGSAEVLRDDTLEAQRTLGN